MINTQNQVMEMECRPIKHIQKVIWTLHLRENVRFRNPAKFNTKEWCTKNQK